MLVCIVKGKAAFSASTATGYKNDLFHSVPPSKQNPPPLETVSQFDEAVIPGEPNDCGRDPWFDRLTTLSEVEGEPREAADN